MYRWLLGLTGIAAMGLGAVLIVAPALYLGLYVDAPDDGMGFSARRLAPAIIGLGALMILFRDLPDGRHASGFCLVAAAVWVGVALTGIHAFATGTAGIAIIVAAATEIVLAALFFFAAREKSTRAP